MTASLSVAFSTVAIFALAVSTVAISVIASPAPAQQTHVVIISGLSGGPEYAARFAQWAEQMIDAAQQRFAVPPANIVYLSESPPTGKAYATARASRESVAHVFDGLAARAAADDAILILLIGHGSAQGGEPRFNLPGPDLTAREFAGLLEKLPTQRVAFVNTASASGDFVAALSARNRIVVTATRSGGEKNETLFGGYFVQAFAADGADVDKDGRVSVFEAFEYARRETARYYQGKHRLQTEHALLDDNGDGQGSREPDPAATDGAVARRFVLSGGPGDRRAETADSALAPLYTVRKELEEQIAVLRNRKATMDSTAYQAELERLLIELAEKNREIRQIERKP